MRRIRITAVLLAAAMLLLPLAGCSSETKLEMDDVSVEEQPVENPHQLINDLLDCLGEDGIVGEKENDLLDQLDIGDPASGAAWRKIAAEFERLNAEEELHYGCCPDGLPEDGSLCIVVLGYQLNPGGGMSAELLGRLETAFACAEKYPEALIAVTGGGTAAENPDVTEAGSMADWLVGQGIPEERILIEDQSLTTGQNAVYTARLLREEHPEVQSLVIVTSDYHVRCGWMCFATEFALSGDTTKVISNAAYETEHTDTPLDYQTRWMGDVWSMHWYE